MQHPKRLMFVMNIARIVAQWLKSYGFLVRRQSLSKTLTWSGGRALARRSLLGGHLSSFSCSFSHFSSIFFLPHFGFLGERLKERQQCLEVVCLNPHWYHMVLGLIVKNFILQLFHSYIGLLHSEASAEDFWKVYHRGIVNFQMHLFTSTVILRLGLHRGRGLGM